MVAGTMGKIAHEVILLQKSEVMELEEPHHHGKVGSSTMPHKRNPMGCEGIMALSRLARSLAPACSNRWPPPSTSATGPPSTRSGPRCPRSPSRHGRGASRQIRDVIARLIVYRDRMQENVDALHGLILSEAVMLALGEHVGRQVSHDIVYEAAMAAFETQPAAEGAAARRPAA